MQLVFDGHNDVLSRLLASQEGGGDPIAEFVKGTARGHIDAPRARAGGLAGGLCALYVGKGGRKPVQPLENGGYRFPFAEPIDQAFALEKALGQTEIAERLDAAGAWRLCRSVAEIEAAMAAGSFAAVLHMEGAEPLEPDLGGLEDFYARGLRSLGPVWSRNNAFAHGVPFAFRVSPDTGPGLTEAGFALVRECDRLGIVIDLAHITEKGFWDVEKTSRNPLVVSHSNAHALTPVARNLTDRQLDAVRASDGVVGLNFAVSMLREDGRNDLDTPLSDMVRHIDHLVARLGIDGVAIGSDFDGAPVPAAIGSASGLQKLVEALAAAGYGEPELEKICRGNWLRVLRRIWES